MAVGHALTSRPKYWVSTPLFLCNAQFHFSLLYSYVVIIVKELHGSSLVASLTCGRGDPGMIPTIILFSNHRDCCGEIRSTIHDLNENLEPLKLYFCLLSLCIMEYFVFLHRSLQSVYEDISTT
jgi:hypothetical protein